MKLRLKKVVEYEELSWEVKTNCITHGIVWITLYFIVSLWNHSFNSYYGQFPSILLLFLSIFSWIVLIIAKLTKRNVYFTNE